jgi:hypothetical protein
MNSAVCFARAIILNIGLTPDEAGKVLASAMNKFFTPKTSPSALQTASLSELPIRAVPIW